MEKGIEDRKEPENGLNLVTIVDIVIQQLNKGKECSEALNQIWRNFTNNNMLIRFFS